jgi:tetratricopeptide (TPR) repeat protein
MMKYTTLVVAFFLISTPSIAQQPEGANSFLDKYLTVVLQGDEKSARDLVLSNKQDAATAASLLLDQQAKATQQADYAKSLVLLRFALKINQQLGDRIGELRALSSLGGLYRTLGNTEEALRYFRAALEISQQTQNRWVQAIALGELGKVYKDSGDYEQALSFWQESLKLHQENSNRPEVARTLLNIGDAWLSTNKYSEALAAFKGAEQIGWTTGELDTAAKARYSISSILQQVPSYAWPPIKASAFVEVPRQFLAKRDGQTHLSDVSDRLKQAFYQAGYGELSWYSVPEGFAVVSRLEHFNPDGTPVQGSERWATKVTARRIASLTDFLKALFLPNPGYYRIIVFIVTRVPFTQTDSSLTGDQALAWLSKGANVLPSYIGEALFSTDHNCTALIYEFYQATAEQKAEFKYPGSLTGKTHLEKSGIYQLLEK